MSLVFKLFCTLFTCKFYFPAKRLCKERHDKAYCGMLDFLYVHDAGDYCLDLVTVGDWLKWGFLN